MTHPYANRFYVYVYYDLDGVPFYVGKGHGNRAYAHLKNARKWNTTDRNKLKIQLIREILDLGKTPSIKFVEINLTESEAKDLERELIKQYGRLDRGTGTLTNLTDGGEGTTGHRHTESTKLKLSKALTGRKVSDYNKDRLSKWMKVNNPMFRQDVIEKCSGENHWNYGGTSWNKGIPMTEEAKKHLSMVTSGVNHHFYGKKCSEERREAIRKATTGVKKSTTINMKKPKKKETCKYCNQQMSGGNLKRWHDEKCKMNPARAQ